MLLEPHLIEEVIDADGRVAYSADPAVSVAVTPQVAYMMNRLLAGVITDGTERSAAALKLNLAGKTGTTDDNTDAWFLGYGPDLAVGVWVGFDERRSLGKKETGATAALPIWRAFMEETYAGRQAQPYPMPGGITVVPIDRRTGLRANPRAYCRPVISEVFVAGTEPTESCSVYEHQRLRLPYAFQAFDLNDEGRLVVPSDKLYEILDRTPNASLVDGQRRLEVRLPTETVSIPIDIVPVPYGPPMQPDPRLAEFDVESWIGKDGQPAEILWVDGRPQRRASN